MVGLRVGWPCLGLWPIRTRSTIDRGCEVHPALASYVKLARLTELPPGSAIEVEFDGCIVALFRDVAGEVRALDGICPHQGGPLASGHVHGGAVTCPWHGWSFDLDSGCSRLTPRIVQTTYPVRLDGDDVLVALPERTGGVES
jgi:nitrite reductase/ring-hydroxylating ferredoxin subunit